MWVLTEKVDSTSVATDGLLFSDEEDKITSHSSGGKKVTATPNKHDSMLEAKVEDTRETVGYAFAALSLVCHGSGTDESWDESWKTIEK